MKKLFAVSIIALSLVALIDLTTGCIHTPVVNPDGTTNVVTTVDPVKLQKARLLIQPAVSGVFTRVIRNSPQHAAEIAGYARGVGQAFWFVKTSGRFSPSELLTAIDNATQKFQATAPPEIIDGKNSAVALYTLLWDDKLTVNVPFNGWPMAVCTLFSDMIDQALKDAGQPGI